MLILARDRAKSPDRGYAKTFLTPARGVPRHRARPWRADRRQRRRAEPRGPGRRGARAGRAARHRRRTSPTSKATTSLPGPATSASAPRWPPTPTSARGASSTASTAAPTSSSPAGSPTPRSSSGPPRPTSAGPETITTALAGAVAAGHVIECGAQATGGNYAFFTEVARPDLCPGFPLAEIHADGSSVITKHPGTGGAVSVDTVTAQLLYEITGARYANPDVTLRVDTIELSGDGPDRVRINGVRGEPPPPTLKVSLNSIGGFRNAMTFVLTGLDIDAKAELVRRQLESGLTVKPAELEWTLARTDHADADTEEAASALLRCVVRDPDPANVGRQFSSAAVELALASYPGFTTTAPPGEGQVYGVFTAGLRRRCRGAARRRARRRHPHRHRPRQPDPGARTGRHRSRCPSPCRSRTPGVSRWAASPAPAAATRAATPTSASGCAPARQWRWLAHALTVDKLRELLPETSRSAGHPARAAQPAGGELRHRGHPRRGRGLSGPLRPASQGPRRVAAQPAHRHTRKPSHMTIWQTPERDDLRKTVRAFAEREVLPHVDEWETVRRAAPRPAPQGRRGRPARRRAARGRRRWRRRRRRRGDHLRGDALRRVTGRSVRVAVHLRHRGAAHDRVG